MFRNSAAKTAARGLYAETVLSVYFSRSTSRLQRHMTAANRIPATGHTIQVVVQAFVQKLKPRYMAAVDSQ